MNLAKKICAVLFSDNEQKFRTLVRDNQYIDAKKLLSETVLKSEEYSIFQTKTGLSINDFLTNLSTYFNTHFDEFAEYDHEKKKWSEKYDVVEEKCKFPGCDATERIQKDHIIPSSINKTSLFQFTKEESNLLPLCPFHNRVKTNSILIGIAFLLE